MPPISTAEYIENAELCERLAEAASSADNRENMHYLALRWRILASEAGATIKPATRQQTGRPLYPSE
jgi:hypothetical protein